MTATTTLENALAEVLKDFFFNHKRLPTRQMIVARIRADYHSLAPSGRLDFDVAQRLNRLVDEGVLRRLNLVQGQREYAPGEKYCR